MYLIIDTSTKYGAVGLWQEGALVRSVTWHSRQSHTAELMPAVEAMLAQHRAAPAALKGIAVAVGPGGFSALRAGMGAAKGLAFALSLPIVGVSTLEAAAYPYRDAGYPLCSLIESGREIVAWARFQQTEDGWTRLTPDRVTPVAELFAVASRHTLFCGESVAAYTRRLREAMRARAHFIHEPTPLSRLLGVAALGAARLDVGDVDNLAALQPHYLRMPTITPAKAPQPVKMGQAPKEPSARKARR